MVRIKNAIKFSLNRCRWQCPAVLFLACDSATATPLFPEILPHLSQIGDVIHNSIPHVGSSAICCRFG